MTTMLWITLRDNDGLYTIRRLADTWALNDTGTLKVVDTVYGESVTTEFGGVEKLTVTDAMAGDQNPHAPQTGGTN